MRDDLKTGLIGAGVFASYHASKIEHSGAATFSGIYDPDQDRAEKLAGKHSTISFDTPTSLFERSEAVIIAAPAIYHFELGKQALEAGCHVMMEKPLALTGADARELATLADKKHLILQVGHQERLVCRALGLFDIAEAPHSINIVRNGPPPQNGRAMDTSVLWDLMIHDIDLVHALISGDLSKVQCEAHAELGEHFDMACADFYLGDTHIKLAASRIAPDRERKMVLEFGSGRIALDFLTREIENTSSYKTPDELGGLVPDPLGAADEMFFRACRGVGAPLLTGHEAAKAVATAELLSKLA